MFVDLSELPEPWHSLPEDEGEGFIAELNRETSTGHVLFGRNDIRAIARREDCDDVLFTCGSVLALVHLAYAGREDDPRWPSTELFSSWNEFVSVCSQSAADGR